MIQGRDLIAAGMKPGKWFVGALEIANNVLNEGASHEEAIAAAKALEPAPIEIKRLRSAEGLDLRCNFEASNEVEAANFDACVATMTELLRTPHVRGGALMPDACPAGSLGTIPVGGVAVSEHLHPGMHSADVCCSVAASYFRGVKPGDLLDAIAAVTHFGPGGRPLGKHVPMPESVVRRLGQNKLFANKGDVARSNFATQGDGNHFAFVGLSQEDMCTVLVTHHGSRGLGAALYKDGMRMADYLRSKVSPETLKQNAWIDRESHDGEDYWDALQAVRMWTRESHYALHDLAASKLGVPIIGRFWNEHNFVFQKSDGLFYHAKGATPAFDGWAGDSSGFTMIPLNMAQPILIVQGHDNPYSFGFAPHGAGRNFSRTQHMRNIVDRDPLEVFKEETVGIDARFHMGTVDLSELPSAYKNADNVRRQIEQFNLATVVDQIMPYGSIMAGDWEANMPWRRKPTKAKL